MLPQPLAVPYGTILAPKLHVNPPKPILLDTENPKGRRSSHLQLLMFLTTIRQGELFTSYFHSLSALILASNKGQTEHVQTRKAQTNLPSS